MIDTYFITGATGTLGKRIVVQLLEHTESNLILLLHKQGRGTNSDKLLRDLFGINNSSYVNRVKLVQGDITQPRLGLETELYKDISACITHIIHSAASTRFDLSLEKARLINVEGTKNTLGLFEHLKSPTHFAFLSTAYVAGKNTGTIMEQPLSSAAGFVNTYEQSKYEAEQCVQKSEGVTSIYRLSTIIGDSTTGAVDHFTAPHQALRIMHIGLAAMVPGTPDYVVDLIPSDYASRAIINLLIKPLTFGNTYHITAGADRSFTLQELLEQSFKSLTRFDPEWARKGYPSPPIVSQQTFDLFLSSAEDAGNILVHNVLGAMKHFAHQLTFPKEFDRTNIDAALPSYHIDLPHISTYYPDVVKYCVSTKFGRT